MGVQRRSWFNRVRVLGAGAIPAARSAFSLGEGGDDAVVVTDRTADAHEGAPGRFPKGVGGQYGLGQALGVGVLVGRVGGVGGCGASLGCQLGKLLSAVVYPGGTDAGKVFAASQRCERVFGGGDEFAALQARRGGEFLFEAYRFTGQHDVGAERDPAVGGDAEHVGGQQSAYSDDRLAQVGTRGLVVAGVEQRVEQFIAAGRRAVAGGQKTQQLITFRKDRAYLFAVEDDRGAAELDQLDRGGNLGWHGHALGGQGATDPVPGRVGVRFGVDTSRHHRREIGQGL